MGRPTYVVRFVTIVSLAAFTSLHAAGEASISVNEGTAGADICYKIQTALNALGPDGGLVDARSFAGTPALACSVNPFAPWASVGFVDTSGTTVTLHTTSPVGDKFVPLMVGKKIVINGTTYTIASWTDATHIVLTTTARTQTNVAYFMDPLAGVVQFTVLLGPTNFQTTAPWRICSRCRLIGLGRGNLSPNAGTTIQSVSGFPTDGSPVIDLGVHNSFGIELSELHVDCSANLSNPQGIGVRNFWSQEQLGFITSRLRAVRRLGWMWKL